MHQHHAWIRGRVHRFYIHIEIETQSHDLSPPIIRSLSQSHTSSVTGLGRVKLLLVGTSTIGRTAYARNTVFLYLCRTRLSPTRSIVSGSNDPPPHEFSSHLISSCFDFICFQPCTVFHERQESIHCETCSGFVGFFRLVKVSSSMSVHIYTDTRGVISPLSLDCGIPVELLPCC